MVTTAGTEATTVQKKKPIFVKVDQLEPGKSGYNLTVKVIESNPIKPAIRKNGSLKRPIQSPPRIAECLIGDETGCILFTARNDQVDVMKTGATVTLRNAKIDMFKDTMRLAVDKWGLIQVTDPVSFEVWALAPMAVDVTQLEAIQDMKQPLNSCKSWKNLPPTGLSSSPLYPWLLWQLWSARNKRVFEGKVYTAEETILKAIIDGKAWEEARQQLKKTALRKTPRPTRYDPARRALFTDGAWNKEARSGGMGWRILSPTSTAATSTSCGSSARRWVDSAFTAEALAIRDGLKSAVNSQFKHLQVCSDSEVLISALSSGREITEIAGILCDIRSLALSFSLLSFHVIPRLENTFCDRLAKEALASLSFVSETV